MKTVLFFAFLLLICAVAWYRKMDFQVPDRSVIIVLDDRTLPAEAYKDIQRGAETASRNLHVKVVFRKNKVDRDALRDEHPDAVVVLYHKDPVADVDDTFFMLDVAKMASPLAAGYAAVLMGRVEWNAGWALRGAAGQSGDGVTPAPPGTSRPYSVFRDDYDRFIVV